MSHDPNALKVRRALALVREARDLLRHAGAKRAAQRVASVIHSVEGAARHAELVDQRRERLERAAMPAEGRDRRRWRRRHARRR